MITAENPNLLSHLCRFPYYTGNLRIRYNSGDNHVKIEPIRTGKFLLIGDTMHQRF